MTVRIQIGDRTVAFTLEAEKGRWHSLEAPTEGDFPLIATVEGKRYELYSDGTFAEVEK